MATTTEPEYEYRVVDRMGQQCNAYRITSEYTARRHRRVMRENAAQANEFGRLESRRPLRIERREVGPWVVVDDDVE